MEQPREPIFYPDESILHVNDIGGQNIEFGHNSISNAKSESLQETAERFYADERNFICVEALKFFFHAENEETALRALELLEKAARF